MTEKDMPFLNHILDAIRAIEESAAKISREEFENLNDIRDACIRRLEIIGEAVKNISEEMKKKYPKVEWKRIAGARDRIIHSYFNVDLDVVWKIVKEDLPILKKQILEIKEQGQQKLKNNKTKYGN